MSEEELKEKAETAVAEETAVATVPVEAEAEAQAETAPQAENAPQAEAAPQAENAPQAEAAPQAENAPQAEAAPQTENAPQAEAAPQTENAPQAEAAPQTEAQAAESEMARESAEGASEEEMDDEFVDAESESVPAPQKEFAPITVKTTVNLDTRAALARCMILDNWLPFALLSALFMTLGAILWIVLGDDDMFIGISVLVLGLLIPAGVFGMTLLLAKANAKKAPGAKDIRTVTLTFAESITGVETAENVADKPVQYGYDMIYKVRQSKDYFFLFVDSRSAIVVSKAGIEAATEADLKELLDARCTTKPAS